MTDNFPDPTMMRHNWVIAEDDHPDQPTPFQLDNDADFPPLSETADQVEQLIYSGEAEPLPTPPIRTNASASLQAATNRLLNSFESLEAEGNLRHESHMNNLLHFGDAHGGRLELLGNAYYKIYRKDFTRILPTLMSSEDYFKKQKRAQMLSGRPAPTPSVGRQLPGMPELQINSPPIERSSASDRRLNLGQLAMPALPVYNAPVNSASSTWFDIDENEEYLSPDPPNHTDRTWVDSDDDSEHSISDSDESDCAPIMRRVTHYTDRQFFHGFLPNASPRRAVLQQMTDEMIEEYRNQQLAANQEPEPDPEPEPVPVEATNIIRDAVFMEMYGCYDFVEEEIDLNNSELEDESQDESQDTSDSEEYQTTVVDMFRGWFAACKDLFPRLHR